MVSEWKIEFYDGFYDEYLTLPQSVQNELLASLIPLKILGAGLGRPKRGYA